MKTDEIQQSDSGKNPNELPSVKAAQAALEGNVSGQENSSSSPLDDEETIEFEGLEGSVGLGVDLVEIERIRRVLARTPRFAVRVYTEDEQRYCESKAQPAIHYATRFAAKEAVLKALGTGFALGIAPADVEVVRNVHGRPTIQLHGRAAAIAKSLDVREIPVSLSYTHDEAVACAMAITSESVRVAEERIDPMEELAKQFKEARSLLDDLPVRYEDGTQTGRLPDMPLLADAAADGGVAEIESAADGGVAEIESATIDGDVAENEES